MNRLTNLIKQLVEREGAEQYLLITLLSFAASISLVRLFLELTDYPQLGRGSIHIAHVLWGGLLLFIAAIAPLLFANRWVYRLSAILSGVGVGLFIDEIGKFITSNNDYFYPLAAPIIYAFFLLTVLLYLQIRRPSLLDARVELYRALEGMEEVLERDLDPMERARLQARLEYVAGQTEHPDFARLAENLLAFLDSEDLQLVYRRSILRDFRLKTWKRIEVRWINKFRLKAVLTGGLLALGLIATLNIIRSLPIGNPPTSLEYTLTRLIVEGQLSTQRGLNWFAARLALETSVGFLLLTAAFLLILNRDRFGISLGYLGLLLSLTTVNLLVFYFDQFSAIITAAIQFGLLVGIVYYRQRFLQNNHILKGTMHDSPKTNSP